jgi:short-subunit dehydrogenase
VSRVSGERIAVVTGGSAGIGEAIARELTARGWRCVLVARNEERLRALAAELDADYELCDVADRAQVDAVAARVAERHPSIGLLVNNAGMPGRTDFLATDDPDRIQRVVDVNYLGNVWCLRAFLPLLEAHGAARVVNVVSVAGTVGSPGSGPYSASKHAQLAFSRAVTAELQPRGIRVHTVNPGFVESEGFPQRGVLPKAIEWMVIDPPDVARHVMTVLERNKRETFVPWYYRIAAISQAVLPGVVAAAQARLGTKLGRK